jgi:alanine racemase
VIVTIDDASIDRWAWAEIDLDAVEHNVRLLREVVAPAALWAVVKADGYGHGSVAIAESAMRAGATGLCVALVDEGVRLREAGIDAPILVLTEQPTDQVDIIVANGLTATVSSVAFVEALSARASGTDDGISVHVCIDTGMQRAGVAPGSVVELVESIDRSALELEGVYTHLACADQPDHPANATQLERFDQALRALAAGGRDAGLVHAANSAAALAIPEARHALVRAGIAIYGVSPGAGVEELCSGLRPAMTLAARVSRVKRVEAGSSVSYGWRHTFERDSTIVTVPVGYADGVPRRLGTVPGGRGADVLIGGRRHPIVGVVTMDQLMVEVGDADVEVGDRVVLIGMQGRERIRAEEWADRLGTIAYEIVCGISERIPRLVRGAAVPS